MPLLTLLLCLLMVASLRWIIGFAKAPTVIEQHDALVSMTYLSLEAVNTGFRSTPLGTSIRAEDAACIVRELLSAASDTRPQSTETILYRSDRPLEFEFIRIAADRVIENLLPASDRA